MKRFNHTALKSTLLILMAFTAITALATGFLLMVYPDGSILNLSTDMLTGTPFKNYTVPGLLLVVFIGLVNLVGLFLYLTSNKKIFNWALAAGVVMILWLLVQFVLIPSYYWIYIIYLVIGLLIVLISFQLKGKAII